MEVKIIMKKFFPSTSDKKNTKYDTVKIARMIIEFLKHSDREKRRNLAQLICNSNEVEKFMELNTYADYNMSAADNIMEKRSEKTQEKGKWLASKPAEKIIETKNPAEPDSTEKIFIDFLSNSTKLERAKFISIIKEEICYDKFLEINKYVAANR
jgi:hypothetical protein